MRERKKEREGRREEGRKERKVKFKSLLGRIDIHTNIKKSKISCGKSYY